MGDASKELLTVEGYQLEHELACNHARESCHPIAPIFQCSRGRRARGAGELSNAVKQGFDTPRACER